MNLLKNVIVSMPIDDCSGRNQSITNISWLNISVRKELTESVVNDFNAANPDIDIIYVLNTTDDHNRLLKLSATDNALPDIWFNWGGTLGSFFTKNGYSYDLSEYAKENNWNRKFTQAALSLSTLDGILSGYPTSINMIGMFYRKDIFQECGLSVPGTFEEFENIMATLKSKKYTPMALCGLKGWHVLFFIEALIEMYAGSDEHDRLYAGKSSWNTDSVIKAFTKYKEYIDKGYFPDKFETLRGYESKNLLYSKKAAMSFDISGMESNIHGDKQDPDLYDYFKLPLSQKGNRMSGFVEMIQFNANLSQEKLSAAMRFVDYLCSPESIAKYGNLIKQPVPRLDNILPEKMKMVPRMINDLAKFGSFTISDQALPQPVVNELFKAQHSIAMGILTPQQVIEFMQKSIEAYYKSL